MNITIARITARALVGRRRFLLLLPLPALLVGLAVLSDSLTVPSEWVPPVVLGLGFAVVLPVMALIVGTGVLGAEIDDGTIVHILAKPLPRRQIIFAKLVVAAVVTSLTVGVPMLICGLLAGSVRFAIALAVASVAGALAYSALFLALSVVTRRPVLLGLVYVLVWEGLLGNLLSGVRVLSIEQYAITIADKIAPTDMLTGTVSINVAVIMATVLTVGATVLAIDRLRSFSVAGETS